MEETFPCRSVLGVVGETSIVYPYRTGDLAMKALRPIPRFRAFGPGDRYVTPHVGAVLRDLNRRSPGSGSVR
jgi:hypothetical protein